MEELPWGTKIIGILICVAFFILIVTGGKIKEKLRRSAKTNKTTKEGELKLPGPKGIPQVVGTHMVVEEKKDPNWVWDLKGVVHPTEKEKAFYCRLFSEAEAAQAGVKVKDWSSLDDHPGLILWEGYFDTETNTVRLERFPKSSSSSD